MKTTVVVGSGASGVHFSAKLLEKGRAVTMVDVGHRPPAVVAPEASLARLKDEIDDPAAYLLGDDFSGVLLPDDETEYYGFPPSKGYVFRQPPGFRYQGRGFSPLFSFARGGLAEAWTAGCYPLNDSELADFPVSYADLAPYYSEIAAKIGVTGEPDDLARFMPLHDNLLPPLEMDPHSRVLTERYAMRRAELNGRLGCYLGRTRVATLSRDLGNRKRCGYLGRCLWGCPSDSLYTPSQTLRRCMADPNFTYIGAAEARYFRIDRSERASTLMVRKLSDGGWEELPIERLVLAAGTLASSKILLESVLRGSGERLVLGGLMDNRQVLAPFVNLRLIGSRFPEESYQYHLLGLGIEAEDPRQYVHCQITTLKNAQMHAIAQRLPFDLGTSTLLARSSHAALGLVNLNFHDTRRAENTITLAESSGDDAPSLEIDYRPEPLERERLRRHLRTVRSAFRRLGCLMVPGMSHLRPMGASVHYAGTVPMSASAVPWTTDALCRSRELENVYFVDGTTFPFLPAKNLTFTLMANALRVADGAF